MSHCKHFGAAVVAASTLISSLSIARTADDRFASVDAAMQPFIDAREISGAVVLLADHGNVAHLGTVGMADNEKQTPMAADTMFGIMSMTKPFTATAMMILADEGKLSIDDPVEKYIPAFANSKTKDGELVRGLKIRHLLTHTSGLIGDQKCEGSLEDTAAMLAARPFGFQPGDKWEYGPSLNVCGRIIEIASGQPYEEFLAQRIFRPLSMDDTTFHLTPDQRTRLAMLYKVVAEEADDGKKLVSAERWANAGAPGATPNPSGGLFSTADDLFRFYQMILYGGEFNGKRILSADAVRQMTSPQTGDLKAGFTPGSAWGLGWSIAREPEGVTGMLSSGSFGHGGAFGTEGWIDPTKQRVYVLLIQWANIGNSDGSEIRKTFQQAAADSLEK